MLKKYKNELYKCIETNSLDAKDFEWIDEDDQFDSWDSSIIQFRDTAMCFIISKHSHNNPGYYNCISTIFDSGFPREADSALTFDKIYYSFDKWISDHLKPYIEEEQDVVDLWEKAQMIGRNLNIEDIDFTDNSAFNLEEKKLLKMGLSEIPQHIKESGKFTDHHQQKVIEKRINYLIEAVDRLNKTDWKGVAISVIVGISTALTLDTEKVNCFSIYLREYFLLFLSYRSNGLRL